MTSRKSSSPLPLRTRKRPPHQLQKSSSPTVNPSPQGLSAEHSGHSNSVHFWPFESRLPTGRMSRSRGLKKRPDGGRPMLDPSQTSGYHPPLEIRHGFQHSKDGNEAPRQEPGPRQGAKAKDGAGRHHSYRGRDLRQRPSSLSPARTLTAHLGADSPRTCFERQSTACGGRRVLDCLDL